jgi:hypothetical protein
MRLRLGISRTAFANEFGYFLKSFSIVDLSMRIFEDGYLETRSI